MNGQKKIFRPIRNAKERWNSTPQTRKAKNNSFGRMRRTGNNNSRSTVALHKMRVSVRFCCAIRYAAALP